MSSTRLPILCVGLLALFAGTMGQAGCSDSETTAGTNNPTTTTTTSSMSTSTGMGANGGGGTGPGGNGGGGAGGGGNMNTGTDTCDGDPINIGLGFAKTVFGDTTNAADDYASPCEDDGSGPDVVYQLNVSDAGTLSISLTPGGNTDVTMYLRTACEDGASNRWCRNGAGQALQRTFISHLNAGTYHLIIDTNGATGGPFALSMALTAPQCGDGATNPNEQCDDGNLDTGDGCDNNCDFEAGSNDSCADPETPADIAVGDTILQGNTLGNGNNHSFDNAGCGVVDTGGKDRVYALTPAVTGMMRLRLGWDMTNADPSYCAISITNSGCWDRVLSVRHQAGATGELSCANQSNQIACGGPGDSPTYVQDLTFPVDANETYFVFVDSFWDGGGEPTYAAGPYFLHVNLATN